MTNPSSPLRFVVPMPEPITNASGRSRHWRVAHSAKRKFWALLDAMTGIPEGTAFIGAQSFLVPRPPVVPLSRAAIRSTMYLGGAMDDDNAMARHKPLLDWLKTRGYLVDDRKKNIVWESLPTQVVKRDGRYRIELTVTPL